MPDQIDIRDIDIKYAISRWAGVPGNARPLRINGESTGVTLSEIEIDWSVGVQPTNATLLAFWNANIQPGIDNPPPEQTQDFLTAAQQFITLSNAAMNHAPAWAISAGMTLNMPNEMLQIDPDTGVEKTPSKILSETITAINDPANGMEAPGMMLGLLMEFYTGLQTDEERAQFLVLSIINLTAVAEIISYVGLNDALKQLTGE